MKVLLLVLLLAVCVNCGGDIFKTKLGAKIKEIVDKIKTSLNVTSLLAIREKFLNMRGKAKSMLALSPQQKAEVQKKLQNVPSFKADNKEGGSISEINEKSGMGELLFQGDIVLTEKQADEVVESLENEGTNRTKRQAFRDRFYPQTIWSEGVNYFFDNSATDVMRRVFVKATQYWASNTCIDFRENEAENAVRLFRENGCWSMIGNIHQQQPLSLGEGCVHVGIATHELGHAIGFWHTHARHDRDEWITFVPDNVMPSWLDQFRKETPDTNENYGLPYDYGSIMHYAATSATQNGNPTMVPRDEIYRMTLGSPFISFYEKLMINMHYGCTKNCDESASSQCKMGGFAHPRDCSICICPGGYGGPFCDQRPEGCGGELDATEEVQVLEDEVGERNSGEREDMTVCNYWIRAPEGARIEVKVRGLPRGNEVDGCTWWGVEMKTQQDQRLTGYRVCANVYEGLTLTSSSNLVPIIVYNRVESTPFALEYRIV